MADYSHSTYGKKKKKGVTRDHCAKTATSKYGHCAGKAGHSHRSSKVTGKNPRAGHVNKRK